MPEGTLVMKVAVCIHCGQSITLDSHTLDGVETWVDETDGDACDGGTLVVYDGVHEPAPGTVCIVSDDQYAIPEAVGRPTIVVTGNPLDGFTHFGPWDVREDAEKWADQLDDEWWLVTLLDPAGD